MLKLFEKKGEKVGAPPGTLIHLGEKMSEKAKIEVIDYDATHLRESTPLEVEDCIPFKDSPTVTWINVDGLHEVEKLRTLGDSYGLHLLVLEDILDTNHRPKSEDFDEYIYIVFKMLFFDGQSNEIEAEQVSLVLGQNFVLSFQEKDGDVFDPIRDRIRQKKGRIRERGADYLAYALLDTVVDNYFIVLGRLEDKIESLEDALISNPTPETLRNIHILTREMIFLHKFVGPLREVVDTLQDGESSLLDENTTKYFKDVYDHTIQVIDSVDTFREMLSGMLGTYLSTTSNRMNEAMKVLTIIATIFIPLSFVAGLYGMNFKYMPELEWRWGYFMVLLVMFTVGASMIYYFKRKNWI